MIKTEEKSLVGVNMRCLVGVVIVLSSLSGWSCAQAPGDADPICTETLPTVGVNILDYPPEVKPLMDSHHYQQLLPPNLGAVWQEVDNDNNNPSGTVTRVSWHATLDQCKSLYRAAYCCLLYTSYTRP